MTLDTKNLIYLCTDITNGTQHVLFPSHLRLEVAELRVDNPDPESTDAAEFKLLRQEMTEYKAYLP